MVNCDTVLLSLESESTVTGRCLVFLEKTMDEMDSLPEMKGRYERLFSKTQSNRAIIKNKVERSKFEDKKDLRVTEACNYVPPNHLHAFVPTSFRESF
ncbi:hypothetical protein EDC94DRAFT_655645 [Helicostylum pulchrum]|nr:hypothetical protein EDC94DRAFT_655645 [Helicostylum pulchrum]